MAVLTAEESSASPSLVLTAEAPVLVADALGLSSASPSLVPFTEEGRWAFAFETDVIAETDMLSTLQRLV